MAKLNKLKELKSKLEPPKGRPMLYWVGKKPLEYVKGFPARLTEVFDPAKIGLCHEPPVFKNLEKDWQNLLFHGDNKEVLATLLENGFRGKVDLIYIDPPFDSGANYVRKAELRGLKGNKLEGQDYTLGEQTMYFDIWKDDFYLQWMYERLQLLKELLSETGSIYVHLDYRRDSQIRLIMDEVFGSENIINEIIWCNTGPTNQENNYPRKHQVIYFYSKNKGQYTFNSDEARVEYKKSAKTTGKTTLTGRASDEVLEEIDKQGKVVEDWWADIPDIGKVHSEDRNYPTQKTTALLERIIKVGSKSENIVLDCFIGSGTTAAVAQSLGRRWIGCDINKGAIQTTSKELQKIILDQIKEGKAQYPSFAVYQVNDYDLKLLRTEAIELAIEHIGIERRKTDSFFDGTLGRELVKIIDFNHPLTLLDLQILEDELKKRPDEERNIVLVCLGKELAADPWLTEWNKKHPVNKVRVIELRTDKKYGKFLLHQPAIAKVKIERKGDKAIIDILDFNSPTIIERLNDPQSVFKVKIPDFRAMIDVALIDTDYDGKTFRIIHSDVPEKKSDYISGHYELDILKKKTTVAVKIIDMLGEEVLMTKQI